jgi:HSP20 family protein
MRRDPIQEMFDEMRRMQRDMDRLTRHSQPMIIKRRKKNKCLPNECKIRTPITAMKETESAIVAEIELPGMNKEDIQLHVTTNQVEIAAKQKKEKKDQNSYAASERTYYKVFSLPADVNPEVVDAEFKNGILHLKLKKAKQVPKKKKIQIK